MGAGSAPTIRPPVHQVMLRKCTNFSEAVHQLLGQRCTNLGPGVRLLLMREWTNFCAGVAPTVGACVDQFVVAGCTNLWPRV